MKLLLCKNVNKLGIVGDVVNVSAGFARNYLLPHGLAAEPTPANVRRVAEARRHAEQERVRQRELLAAFAERLEGVEITVHAKANEEGVLYGSVGPREIAVALAGEGFPVEPEHVSLDAPIRILDNVAVQIKLDHDLESTIKVWVVREKSSADDEDDPSDEHHPSKEAAPDDDRADE